jgi:hypothetical protein
VQLQRQEENKMASTSEWSWISINRETDISVSGGVFSSRPNWSMTRSRISNDTYSGQLGESATSLSAYNGGVTETVIVPVINYLSFDANTAWTLAATRWDATGYIKNGSMSYTPHYGTANIPDAGKKNVAFIFRTTQSGGGTVLRGVCLAPPLAMSCFCAPG